MSQTEVETFENEGGATATETETPAAPAATESPWSPSKEAWDELTNQQRLTVQALQYLAQRGAFAEDTEEDEDLSDLDTGQLVERYVDSRLQQVNPILERTVQEQGEKRLNELLDSLESNPEIGKLSPQARKAAGWAAQAILPTLNTNDPNAPLQAVYLGAKEVAGMTKAEREDAVKEFKASIKRGPGIADPAVSGSGERSLPPAKSYDEVIERWSGQEDV